MYVLYGVYVMDIMLNITKAVLEIRFFKCPDKMSEQAQNCSDICLTLTDYNLCYNFVRTKVGQLPKWSNVRL